MTDNQKANSESPRRLRVLDLFSGLGGWSQAFLDAGHDVVRVELDPRFRDVPGTRIMDARDWTEGGFDVVLASPPCQGFSTASLGHHWGRSWEPGRDADYSIKTDVGRLCLELARWTFDHAPGFGRFVWIENPRAMLRKTVWSLRLPRRTVTYCQYGLPYQKPTDLWGVFPSTWTPRPACRARAPCRQSAPRGSKTGLQGVGHEGYIRRGDRGRHPMGATWNSRTHNKGVPVETTAAKRALVPYELSREVMEAVTAS